MFVRRLKAMMRPGEAAQLTSGGGWWWSCRALLARGWSPARLAHELLGVRALPGAAAAAIGATEPGQGQAVRGADDVAAVLCARTRALHAVRSPGEVAAARDTAAAARASQAERVDRHLAAADLDAARVDQAIAGLDADAQQRLEVRARELLPAPVRRRARGAMLDAARRRAYLEVSTGPATCREV